MLYSLIHPRRESGGPDCHLALILWTPVLFVTGSCQKRAGLTVSVALAHSGLVFVVHQNKPNVILKPRQHALFNVGEVEATSGCCDRCATVGPSQFQRSFTANHVTNTHRGVTLRANPSTLTA